MDFIDQIREHARNIPKVVDQISTEEGAKTALIMPFIQILGYNVFDPREVNPEFIADVGTKKGEKVDYAIIRDGTPILLFECKAANCNLDNEHASQLYRYFSVTPARVGILTNGIIYRFFTDLEKPNKMDETPFLEINLLEIKEPLIEELKKFTKQNYNIDNLDLVAADLKYTSEIKKILSGEFLAPTEDFVRFFASKVYPKKLTQSAKEKFTAVTKNALNQFINEKINERLKSAMSDEPNIEKGVAEFQELKKDDGIITTQDEIDAFNIIRAISTEIIDPSRIYMRDAKSYCAILFDDNNRKPIVRLYFGEKQKSIGVFNNDLRIEEKIQINTLNDLFKVGDQFKGMIKRYLE
jgi:hypothetical protein